MITHEIKKPILSTIVPFVRHGTPLMDRVKDVLGIGSQKDDAYTYHHSMGVKYMDKVPYTRWLEGIVRPKFPVGTLCTMRAAPYVPGQLPKPIFVVSDLQEVCYMAPVSLETGEPKCIFVKYEPTGINVTIAYAPASLRPLTEEELKLVNTRNQEAQKSSPDDESLEQPDRAG